MLRYVAQACSISQNLATADVDGLGLSQADIETLFAQSEQTCSDYHPYFDGRRDVILRYVLAAVVQARRSRE